MFAVGDLVVYGGEGVCRVESIGPSGLRYDGGDKTYYHLAPLYRSGTVMTPVDTAVMMRPIISRDRAMELIAALPQLPPQRPAERGMRFAKDFYHQLVLRLRRAGGHDPRHLPQARLGGAPRQEGQPDGRALSQARRGAAVR